MSMVTVEGSQGNAIQFNPEVSTAVTSENEYTQLEVIQKFMNALDNSTKTSSTDMLDEAIQACTNFNDMDDAINHFIHDANIASNASDFLTNYCGIILGNTDTGAITGSDAGGSAVKSAEDIVPETGSLIIYAQDSFTVNGLTVKLASDADQNSNKYFSALNDTQKYIWNALYTWWCSASFNLIEESYGSGFGFSTASSATVKEMTVQFSSSSSSGALASVGHTYNTYDGKAATLTLDINMYYYSTIDTSDPNGDPNNPRAGYLDRTLAHEFTHAVMAANIIYFNSLPQFIKEGMAELTHGIDDARGNVIATLAGSSSDLATALSLTNTSTGTTNCYAGGYMFLRWLAKNYNAGDVLYGTNGKNNNGTYQGKGKDKKYYDIITNERDNRIIDAQAGNDKVVNSGSNVTIYGGEGNDTINLNGSSETVVYSSSDGKDVIAGFGASDSISIAAGAITTSALKKDNVVLTIGKGSITLNDAKDQFIKVIDADGNLSTKMYGKGTVTVKGTSSAETVTGWTKADSLNGGEGNDTLIGGKGADTLTGGSGADKFYYTLGDGADVITDYTADEDVVVLNGTTVTKVAYVKKSNTDLLFTLKKGSIRFNGSAGNRITFRDAATNSIILNQTFGDPYIYVTNSDYATINTAIDASVYTIDASTRTYDEMIIGNAKNNYIKLGSGSETITTGKGKDTVEYLGGNATITDYTAGSDVIKFTKSDIVSAKLDSSNSSVVFTLKDTGTTTISTLTLQNMVKKKAVQKVTVIDKDGISYSQAFGNPTLTVGNADGDTVIANSDVTVMNAAKRSKSVYLVGNEFDNTIRGGTKADTIEAGLGNDYITGGKGDDIFIFSGGKDTIADYSVAKGNMDSIQLADLTFDTYYVDGKNVVMKFKDAAGTTSLQESDTSLTILNGKDKSITIGSDTKVFNDYYEKIFVKNDKSEIYNAAGDDDSLHTVKLIDASKKASVIYITGNNFSDGTISTIKGGTKADTIKGGTGDDILTGGGGADRFIYAGGNDTITDYTAGADMISFSDTNLISATYSSNDLEFTTDKGILTIKNAIKKKKDQKISILFGTDKISQIYGRESLTIGASDGDTVDLTRSINSDVTVVNASGRDAKHPILIYGNAKTDNLVGSKGKDTIIAGSGNNATLNGGAGDDILTGGSGNNITLSGGAGNDTLNGGTGNNITLNGGAGNDSLNGGVGITFFDPGAGDDVINISSDTNRGKVTITYTSGNDKINNWKTDDVLNLSNGQSLAAATQVSETNYKITVNNNKKKAVGTLDISGSFTTGIESSTTYAGTGADSVNSYCDVTSYVNIGDTKVTYNIETKVKVTAAAYMERFDDYAETMEIFGDTVLSTDYELDDITSASIKENVISIDYGSPIKDSNIIELDISSYVDKVNKNKS